MLQDTEIIFLDIDREHTTGQQFDRLRSALGDFPRCRPVKNYDPLQQDTLRNAGVIVILQSVQAPQIWLETEFVEVGQAVARQVAWFDPLPQIIVIMSDDDNGEKTKLFSSDIACLDEEISPGDIKSMVNFLFHKFQQEKLIRIFSGTLKDAANPNDLTTISNVIFTFLNEVIGFDECTISLLSEPFGRDKGIKYGPYSFRSLFAYAKKHMNYGAPVFDSGSEADLAKQRGYLEPLPDDKTMAKALDNLEPRVIPDLDKAKPEGWSDPNIKSWILVPLVLWTNQPDLIGCITLDSYQPRKMPLVFEDLQFDENSLIGFIDALGEIAAEVIDNTLQKRNRSVLQDIMISVNIAHDLEKLLSIMLEQLHKALKSERSSYFKRREIPYGLERADVYLEKWKAVPATAKIDRRYPPWFAAKPGGLGGRILTDAQPLLIHNVTHPEFAADYFPQTDSDQEVASMLAVPVLVRTDDNPHDNPPRLIGAIFLDHSKPSFFSQYDLELVQQVANFTAALLERTWALELIHATSLDFNETPADQFIAESSEELLLRRILVNALKLTNATSGVIHIIDEIGHSGRYRWLGKVDQPSQISHPEPRLNKRDSTSTKLLKAPDKQRGVPQEFRGSELQETVKDRNITITLGTLLLAANEKVIGILYLESGTKNSFNNIEKLSLRVFATQAAIAIQKKWDLDEQERQQKVSDAVGKAILELAQLLGTRESNTTHKVLAHVAEVAAHLVGGSRRPLERPETEDKTHILTVEDGVLRFRAAYGTELNELERDYPNGFAFKDKPKGIIGRAAKNKAPELHPDVTNKRLVPYYESYYPDTKSELAVPIQDINGTVLGAINIEHDDFNGFDKVDQQALELFASYVAIHLQVDESLNTYQKLRDEAKDNLDKLLHVTAAIKTVRKLYDTESVLEQMIELTRRNTGCPLVLLLMPEPQTDPTKSSPMRLRSITYRRSGYPHKEQGRDTDPVAEAILNGNAYEPRTFQTSKEFIDGMILNDPKKLDLGQDIGPFHSAVYLPVMGRDYPSGVLCLAFTEERGFEAEHIETYEFYAAQISAVYDIVSREFGTARDAISQNIRQDYEDTRRDSNRYYNLSYGASWASLLVIIGGLGILVYSMVLFLQNAQVGPFLSAMIGILQQIAGVFIFTRADAYRRRLDKYHKERVRSKQMEDLLIAANQISQIDQRDKIKDAIIRETRAAWAKEDERREKSGMS